MQLFVCSAGGRISYFICPQAQNMVRAAMFYIIDEDKKGVGVGVFFSKLKAVTADHNLTASQAVGTQVVVQIPGSWSTQLCQDASNLFVIKNAALP